MAENNFSALVKLVVDKAQARTTLQRELKELQKDIELETGVKVNLSDIKQARKEIAQANREQQEGTRENIKLRAQELAHTKMLAKETKAATDLELSSRERVRKLNDQTFKEESSARKKAIQETKLQAQEQKALIESLNTSEKKINRKIKNESYDTNIDKIKKQFQDYGLTVDQAEEKVSVLRSTLSEMQTLSGDSLIKKADEWEKAFADVKVQLDKTKLAYDQLSEVNKIQHLSDTGSFAKQVSDATVEYNKLSTVTNDLKTDFAELQRLQTVLGTSQTDEELISNYEAFNTTLEKVKNNMHVLANEQKQAGTYNSGALAEQKKIDSLAESVLKFRDNNTKMSKDLRRQFTGVYDDLINGTNLTEKEVKELSQQFTNLKLKVRDAGQLGQSFGDRMKNAFKKFSEWGFATGIVTSVTSKLREAVTELKEIDTLLTEISKANDKLSPSDLVQMGDNAFDIASKYGKRASDYLSAVQESSRAGYENAEAIAELSTAIQGAGDVTRDTATSYVVATDKAYKLGGSVEKLTEIFDGTNNITNKNAVNMTELAEAMTIVGSTAASFGIEANETTAAIATMASTTQQSGSEVARAFRAILLNIRQVSDNWLLPSNQFAPYVQKCA